MPICNGAAYRRNNNITAWVVVDYDPNRAIYRLAPFITDMSTDIRCFDRWIETTEDELISSFTFLRNTNFDWSTYRKLYCYDNTPSENRVPIRSKQGWKNKADGTLYEVSSTDILYDEGYPKGSVKLLNVDMKAASCTESIDDSWFKEVSIDILYNEYKFVFNDTEIFYKNQLYDIGDVWRNDEDGTLWQVLRTYVQPTDIFIDIFMYNTPINSVKYTKRTIASDEFAKKYKYVSDPTRYTTDTRTILDNAHIRNNLGFDPDYYEPNTAYRVDLTNMFEKYHKPVICILMEKTDGDFLKLGIISYDHPCMGEPRIDIQNLWYRDAIDYKVKIDKASFGDSDKEV